MTQNLLLISLTLPPFSLGIFKSKNIYFADLFLVFNLAIQKAKTISSEMETVSIDLPE